MCIINSSRKFIFVHIPKCGGTSITHELAELTTWRDLELGSTNYGEKLHAIMGPRFGLYKHSRASEIASVVGQQSWNRYFTFTFVRNPFHRAVSSYKYFRMHSYTYRFIEPIKSFSEFVLWPDWGRVGPDRILQPQHHWLSGPASEGRPIVDFVGKLENYREDLKRIVQLIGAEKDLPSIGGERKNTTSSSKPVEVADALVIERIIHRYSWDFELFGYPKTPPSEWRICY